MKDVKYWINVIERDILEPDKITCHLDRLKQCVFKPMASHAVLADVRALLKNMTDDERLDFFSEIQAGYCRHCGCNDPHYKCQCWNDD